MGGVGNGISIFFLPHQGSHLHSHNYNEILFPFERDLLNSMDCFGVSDQEEECDVL